VENKLEFSIAFPNIGSPYGLVINNSLITMESPEHIYVSTRINTIVKDFFNDNNQLKCVEIGGGYGGLAYWFLKSNLNNISKYTIIDFPLMNVIQGYFLSKAFGTSNVIFYGEKKNENIKIELIPIDKTSEIKNFDLLINENSMPEMPLESVQNYLYWAKENLNGIFYSYNQEAYSPVNGKEQISVPKTISKISNSFELYSRNISWIRNGYVEEVYKVNM